MPLRDAALQLIMTYYFPASRRHHDAVQATASGDACTAAYHAARVIAIGLDISAMGANIIAHPFIEIAKQTRRLNMRFVRSSLMRHGR